VTTHETDELAGHVQAETGAAVSSCAGRVGFDESVEDPFLVLGKGRLTLITPCRHNGLTNGRRAVPKVVYVSADGDESVIDAQVGESVMAAAVRNGVPGIVGECGGNNSCATCHVWVRERFRDLVGGPDDLEDDLLDLGVTDRRECSRLSCQIKLTGALDGLTVDVPAEQN
jgi:2Fe-2S ferredoxin